MPHYLLRINLLLLLLALPFLSSAQTQPERLPFLVPADSLHPGRFWTCLGAGAAIYGAVSVQLYQSWYKDYELVGFHTFNDLGEWKQMDKMGHLFTTYLESRLAYKGARWTGMRPEKARWVGVGVGTLLQTTVEVMDGFSEKWGFSWSDIGFNTLGAGVFMAQEMLWEDQRILLKVSNTAVDYPRTPIQAKNSEVWSSPAQRARELYGVTIAETFLKDYNGMTIWASINPTSFKPDPTSGIWPKWLNVAIGYGAENLYGGFGNNWTDDADNHFSLSREKFPPYRQFYLSLDIDVDRIRTRSSFIRTLLTAVSWIKVPAPTLEWNTQGQLRFHPVYW